MTSKNFSKVHEVKRKNQINIKSKFKIGLATKNQRVSGITLYDCGLSTLPESISNLKSLKTLILEGNESTNIPESIKVLRKRGLFIYK